MLTDAEKRFYKDNGYILLKNIFTTEQIEECGKVYDELFESKSRKNNLEATWKGDWKQNENKSSDDNPLTVLSIHNLQCHDAIFTKMLLNEKLVNAVSELIESPNVLLHHTKAHVKPPGKGAPFPTHQDYHYFPFKDDSMVAVFIHLDKSEPSNGGLAIFPSSHKLGPQENTSDVESHYYVDQTKFSLKDATPVTAAKGDVLIFSYLLVHGSYANTSDRTRRMLLFQLMSAEDVPLKKVHLSPCHGMVLRGRNSNKNADIDKRHEQ